MKVYRLIFMLFTMASLCAVANEISSKEKDLPMTTKNITISIVYDNNSHDPKLQTAWGFACVIKGLSKTILFDTGGDGRILLSNMQKLNIKPKDIDIVVLSHIHGDHTGGIWSFLQSNPNVKIYLPASFPKALKEKLTEQGAQVVEVGDPISIETGVMSTGEMGRDILEQALIISSPKGPIIITGCAHPGIVNVVKKAKALGMLSPALVLGGFHLGSASSKELEEIVNSFQEMRVKMVAPCHCSGDRARKEFKARYKENYIPAGAGSIIEIKET